MNVRNSSGDDCQESHHKEAAEEKVVRLMAELENFRRRTHREMETERRYAEVPLLQDLLPVLDNLNRAEEAVLSTSTREEITDGIRMVARQLADILRQHACEEIPAEGQPFDPSIHEAVRAEVVPGWEPNMVLKVIEPGYRLHDRLIRPARVIVSA